MKLGGRGRTGHGREMSEINVTPLVDVMLVLLIIFMVAAPMMTRGIDVDLPKTTTAEAIEEERIEITLDHEGQLWLAEKPITPERLADDMTRLARFRPGSGVFLKADGRSPYASVLKVMDLIRRSGIEKIAMVTLPAPAPARASR